MHTARVFKSTSSHDILNFVNSSSPANFATHPWASPISPKISVCDVTLRDGEQSPGVSFTIDEKVQIATLLDEMKVDNIVVGFPAVSESEAEAAMAVVKAGLNARLGSFSRLIRKDIDASAQCGAPIVGLTIPTSDWMLKDKLRTTEEALLQKVREIVPYAQDKGLEVFFVLEDATRTPMDRIHRVLELVQSLSVSQLVVADTVGILVPSTTAGWIKEITRVLDLPLGVHFHNDMGLATANALAALENGATQVHATALGLGERAGNVSIEELLVLLHVKYGLKQYQVPLIPKLADLVSKISKRSLAPNQPIIGGEVFSHESGIHVHGILSNPTSYEPFPPALVGREHEIVFGKHSGQNGLKHLLKKHSISLEEAGLSTLLTWVKSTSENFKRLVSETEILAKASELASI